MCKVILFGGTTEGKDLAEFLGTSEIETLVCVATAYGATRLAENPYIRISDNRLDVEAMAELFNEEMPEVVVDATHPYAKEVTANIKAACAAAELPYMRLSRQTDNPADTENAVFVDSVDEAVKYLSDKEGKIFAATGSKELHKYTEIPEYKERVTARVLSTAGVAEECARLGFQGENLICMQGPFSKEMNVAMLKARGAKYLVTKVTGKVGGYDEKIQAAKEADCICVIVGKPESEEGDSYYTCKGKLCDMFGLKPAKHASLVGIGMGDQSIMTGAAIASIQKANLIVGARRMVESVNTAGKDVLIEYNSVKIAEYIDAHPEYDQIAVLLSGDTGFYSGAKKLTGALEEAGCELEVICGISSVSYFMSKIGHSWDDAVIVSNHGMQTSLIPLIRDNHKVFSILGKPDDIAMLAEKLCYYGLENAKLYVGEKLSYPDEVILEGAAANFTEYENDPLAVVVIVNEEYTKTRINKLSRRRDEEFLRGKVPMTKFDVRNASLARLGLEEDSICYDVGTGTGSVSVEMALIASKGHVYGIEKKEEAVALALENKKKFMCDNFTVVPGLAPEAMEELPAPTHVFIGGSSGNMDSIVEAVLAKNPEARFVINCIALESLGQAVEAAKKYGDEESVEICQISSAAGRKLGSYTMMNGENPIYIIAFNGRGLEA